MGMPMSKLVISVSAITAATIVWYFWPVKQKKVISKRRKFSILGLDNVGSSCFLNSILQALSSLQHLENWIAKKDTENSLAKHEFPHQFQGLKYPVIAILYRTVLVVNRVVQKDDYVMSSKLPIIFTNVLRRKGHLIKLTEEQDAVEILQLIFCALKEDTIANDMLRKGGSLNCLDVHTNADARTLARLNLEDSYSGTSPTMMHPNKLYHIAGQPVSAAYHLNGVPILKLAETLPRKTFPPFKGLIASKLECITCFKKTNITMESFNVLSLPLPQMSLKPITLSNLIDLYLKPTVVHGVDCDECSRVLGKPMKSTFAKFLVFGRIPKVLCLHIMRTSWSEKQKRLYKRLDHVAFSLKMNMSGFKGIKDLDSCAKKSQTLATNHVNQEGLVNNLMKMEPLSLESTEPYYELKAVICHEGGVENGHYITLRRCPKDNSMWYNISDDIVRPISIENVLASRAYVLFYEFVSPFTTY